MTSSRRRLAMPVVALLACFAYSAILAAADGSGVPDEAQLASRGALIVERNAEAMRLRTQLPDEAARRGFDIGMAVAETDTLPGPGKQRIHDSLAPTEQDGFAAAVAYSLHRNALIEKGAALAAADPAAMALRDGLANDRARMGFNMGMAVAETDTLPGPGKQKIHDSLDPTEQAGFEAAVTYSLQRNQRAAAGEGNFRETKRDHSSMAVLPGIRRIVPDVVGMALGDATSLLSAQKFMYVVTEEKEPDPSVPYGHVRATIPMAGQTTTDNQVELNVPRSARRVGKATLALSDIERRAGFDLDAGNYEEIFRGADIVLKKHEHEKRVDENGNVYYVGAGIFIEPSDGATLRWLDSPENTVADGGYAGYLACTGYRTSPGPFVKVSGSVTFCVRTAQGAVVVVQFRSTDNPCCSVSNYMFHYALYPRQAKLADPLQRR